MNGRAAKRSAGYLRAFLPPPLNATATRSLEEAGEARIALHKLKAEATLHRSLWPTNALEKVRTNYRAGAVFSPRASRGSPHSRACWNKPLPASVSSKAGGKPASPRSRSRFNR